MYIHKKDVINSIYQTISQLRYVDVDDKKKYDLDALIRSYRRVFGEEYTEDSTTDIIAEKVRREKVDENEIISKYKDKSFFKFLSKHHCCWIDFIGCDSFSSKYNKQLFFSTVSMKEKDVERRQRFLNVYKDLLSKGTIPVDIFVQLFFTNKQSIEEKVQTDPKSTDILGKLNEIRSKGLLVSFKNCNNDSKYVVSTTINCKPVKEVEELDFPNIKIDLLDELVGFLQTLVNHGEPSDLVKKVALLNRSLHKNVHHLYFIPIKSPDGALGLFCYGSKTILNPDERKNLLIFAYNILSPFVLAYKSAWENQQITKEAIKSAISAIMSRNMSHNLGSHYLYYTKAHLKELASRTEDYGPDIRGAAEVLSYIQARMDYLATIISNDKYPNGSVNYKAQLYDELTIDDFSKRHFILDEDISKRTTNFLLSNIILSENFSRTNITEKHDIAPLGHNLLKLRTLLFKDGLYQAFTGTALSKGDLKSIKGEFATIESEAKIKNELSKINLALPGGSMARHAFFNVLENFIRNSAKYLQEDFNKKDGLVITIALKRNDKEKSLFDITIFDNKQNANKLISSENSNTAQTLIQNINDQLSNLRILDENNGIEKSSKGLKEMLFSTVWMRTYTYPDESYADIIEKIHSSDNENEKIGLINKYGFKIVPVQDNGFISSLEDPKANLGITFSIPEFQIVSEPDISNNDDLNNQIRKSIGVNASYVRYYAKDLNEIPWAFKHFFTRSYNSFSFSEEEFSAFKEKARVIQEDNVFCKMVFEYKSVLDKRFHQDIDSFILKFGGDLFEGDNSNIENNKCIYFKRHLNTSENLEKFVNYAYADSVSGGNLTITLNTLFENGLNEEGLYKTWQDKLLGLQIKESALTRITLIDERLFNNMKDYNKELEYSLKNIRILNFDTNAINNATLLTDLFEGNNFRDNKNTTHFLSIHLGLIEKIVKSSHLFKNILDNPTDTDSIVKTFMSKLSLSFGGEGEDIYISVHSGRGNFSKELEGPLADYPFISLPAIENALSNSKYLLCQLFYNTRYIGKGLINKKDS